MTRKLPSDYLAQGWCQDMWACNAAGYSVRANAFEARSWCLHGALDFAHTQHSISLTERNSLRGWLFDRSYTSNWNDDPGRTQAEVVAAMREAEAAVLKPTMQEEDAP